MFIENLQSGEKIEIEILKVDKNDYKNITKAKFWFDWKDEASYDVYKLCIKDTNDILGLISLETILVESRIEIRLLAVSKENM